MNTNFSLMVDLGCGTGLLGPLLRPHTTHMIGIDLSPKMLAIAENDKIGIYDHLFIGDMTVLLSCLEKHRNNKEPKNNNGMRRKLHGSIIRDVSNVRDEGFGGAFLGGDGWLGERKGEGEGGERERDEKEKKGGNTSSPTLPLPLPLLVTAADVLGKYARMSTRHFSYEHTSSVLLLPLDFSVVSVRCFLLLFFFFSFFLF